MSEITPDYLDEANMVSLRFFLNQDGRVKAHLLEALSTLGNAFPLYYLPHKVPVPSGFSLLDARTKEWHAYLKEMTRAPWMRWIQNDHVFYLFVDIHDAVAFRLYVEEP